MALIHYTRGKVLPKILLITKRFCRTKNGSWFFLNPFWSLHFKIVSPQLTYYLQTHDEISMELLILENGPNSVHVQSNIFFWQERYRTKIVLQTSWVFLQLCRVSAVRGWSCGDSSRGSNLSVSCLVFWIGCRPPTSNKGTL